MNPALLGLRLSALQGLVRPPFLSLDPGTPATPQSQPGTPPAEDSEVHVD